MRAQTLSIGASLLPTSFSLVAAMDKDCYGKVCDAINEYCSSFAESCHACAPICDKKSHNYQAAMCAKECAEFNKYEPLKEEIQYIQKQQGVILILLIVLLLLISISYSWQCMRWLYHKRCITLILKKLQTKQNSTAVSQAATVGTALAQNRKDLNATTIQNLNAINHDIEHAASQIYSVTGAAEGSVLTMTTPVSTRYPAENSTTPTTEYSYDNQALAVTPVSEKPNAGGTTASFRAN